jgi:uncharacterized protein (UPF0332 family)
MKGNDFLVYAGKVVALHREEAAARTAISRAYYGAFHATIELLRELQVAIDFNHGHVWQDLQNSNDTTAQEIGRRLQELHANRVTADYRIHDQFVEVRLAMSCVEIGQRIVTSLGKLKETLASAGSQQSFIASITAFRAKLGRRV